MTSPFKGRSRHNIKILSYVIFLLQYMPVPNVKMLLIAYVRHMLSLG